MNKIVPIAIKMNAKTIKIEDKLLFFLPVGLEFRLFKFTASNLPQLRQYLSELLNLVPQFLQNIQITHYSTKIIPYYYKDNKHFFN